uniref:Secreted protein n=1 Tax=Molossus molossus TaxID=27622 RepID=A0A7J8GLF4_MOLMO|nr:hypothetical protein HJG59_011430 [Molossus molossus]
MGNLFLLVLVVLPPFILGKDQLRCTAKVGLTSISSQICKPKSVSFRFLGANAVELHRDPAWICRHSSLFLDICPLGGLVCPRLDKRDGFAVCLRHRQKWDTDTGAHHCADPPYASVFPPLTLIPHRRIGSQPPTGGITAPVIDLNETIPGNAEDFVTQWLAEQPIGDPIDLGQEEDLAWLEEELSGHMPD